MTDEELRQHFEALREETSALRQDLGQEFRQETASLRQEFRQEFAAIRQELREESAAIRRDLRQEFREESASIRQEFAGIREDNIAAHVETRRYMEVLTEETRHEIRIVAEGVVHLREELTRTESRLDAKIDSSISETQALIRFSHGALDQRLRALEQQRL